MLACMRMSAKLAAPLLAVAAIAAQPAAAQTEVEIDFDNPIATIQPEIYGQFVEHLGTQIYRGGLFVGEDSDIPNTDGIRDDVFAALDALDIPVLRWPGGCFADLYHWRDGVGQRTRRDNMAWGNTPEPNTFGTHEFFNLAERLGAKTYLNINVGTGSVREAADWLEYITSTSDGALAEERRANGRAEPWKVDYLTFGNETWDCGGNMRPEYYADLYAQYATFVRTAGDQPYRVLSGSHGQNADYSGKLLENPEVPALADGVSLHFYTLPRGDWSDKGKALGFPESEWASTMQTTLMIDDIIVNQLAVMDAASPDKKLDILPDEWGVWVDTEEGDPALHQQGTIREAVVAALNFNIFHKHAERLPMANIAQMVNVLQAMILTDGPRMTLTPTYHAFEMYRPFQGATALPVTLEGPQYSHGEFTVPALSASAALAANGDLVVALVNADAGDGHEAMLAVGNRRLVSARVLTGDAMDAHNSFDVPDAVAPETADVPVSNGTARFDLPARSVTVATFR